MTTFAPTYERIANTTIGGAGAGNSYNFEVTFDNHGHIITVMCHGERDAAAYFERAGVPVPAELQGPYNGFGRRV